MANEAWLRTQWGKFCTICMGGGERNKVLQNKVFESSHFLVGLFPGYSSTSKLIWDTVENLLSWERLSYFYTSTSAETLFTGSPAAYQDLSTCYDWSVKKSHCSIGPSGWREIRKLLPVIPWVRWVPWGPRTTDLGVASQIVVTGRGPRSRLRLEYRRSYPCLHELAGCFQRIKFEVILCFSHVKPQKETKQCDGTNAKTNILL